MSLAFSRTSHSSVPSTRRPLRSTGIIGAAFMANAVITLATDQVFHTLGVYPPWGDPMFGTGDNMLALSYRILYTVAGAHLVARFARRNPMRHAMIYGAIGFTVAAIGAVFTITRYDLGPDWYPILLAVSVLPSAWLGGASTSRTRSVGEDASARRSVVQAKPPKSRPFLP